MTFSYGSRYKLIPPYHIDRKGFPYDLNDFHHFFCIVVPNNEVEIKVTVVNDYIDYKFTSQILPITRCRSRRLNHQRGEMYQYC